MEFWGVEVKAGESLKVRPELFKLIHVSQAAIGEVKDAKEAKHVPLRLTVGENSYVIGTLSAEDRPQLMFDLVFEKEFELSHGWKNGSVYFIGYTADDPSIDDEIDSGDDDFEDEEDVLAALNGKLEEKKADVKDVKPVGKNAKVAEPKKEAGSDEDDDDSEDDSDDEDDSEDDSDDVPVGMDSKGPEGMDFSDDSEDDDSEEDEDSEEETPKKVEQKKRPAPSPKVAPGSGKKAKQATPDKSGGKKGPAIPFAKQNGKPAANGNNKSKAQSPKSGGQFSGKSNNKNFSGGQQKNFKGKHGKK